MSQVLKAMSDPTRRRVLELLRKGPMTAGQLADHFAVSKPTMSTHFNVLKAANLVHTEKDGTSVIYSLKMSVLEEALMSLTSAFGLQPYASGAGPSSTGQRPTKENKS